MPLTGIAEVALGAALLAGFQARWAAYGLALIMGGAVYSHIAVGVTPQVLPAIVLGLLSLVLGYSAGARTAESTASAQGK